MCVHISSSATGAPHRQAASFWHFLAVLAASRLHPELGDKRTISQCTRKDRVTHSGPEGSWVRAGYRVVGTSRKPAAILRASRCADLRRCQKNMTLAGPPRSTTARRRMVGQAEQMRFAVRPCRCLASVSERAKAGDQSLAQSTRPGAGSTRRSRQGSRCWFIRMPCRRQRRNSQSQRRTSAL